MRALRIFIFVCWSVFKCLMYCVIPSERNKVLFCSDQSSLSAWRNGILGYPKCAQWRFWSACANAQADLNLRCTYISQGTLSNIAALLYEDQQTISSIRFARDPVARISCIIFWPTGTVNSLILGIHYGIVLSVGMFRIIKNTVQSPVTVTNGNE